VVLGTSIGAGGNLQGLGGLASTEQGNGLTTLHYASGHNIDGQGDFVPAQAGFNLADVTSVAQLNALPDGVKGLVWLDQGDGVTQDFIDQVTPFINNPKLYGFFLKDEPDVTGNWGPLVTAADLKAESDWIHANVPDAKTFITMMNMGTAANPTYANTYTPENTHIDLFGITAYPVRSESSTVDYNMIDRNVAAAEAAGISVDQIVPTYQTFGGGNWVTEAGGHYVMPTAAQQQEMFDHWQAVVPNPAFDYAYAWGSQNGDVALEGSQALQTLFLQHNHSEGIPTAPVVDVPPVVDTPPVVEAGGHTGDDPNGSAPPVVEAGGNTGVDTGGSTPPVVNAGGSTPPAGGTTTDPTPSTDPTPVNHIPGWHDGGGHSHGGGLDFSQLINSGKPDSVGSLQSENGGGHSWFASPQNEGGGFSWQGLTGFGRPGSDGAAALSDQSAQSSGDNHHSEAATANSTAASHFMEASSEGPGRLSDQHWHW
jgi:hypothetical protein